MKKLVLVMPALLATLAACDGPVEEREPTLSAIRRDIFEPRCNFGACHGGGSPVRGVDLAGDAHGTLVNVDSTDDPAVKRVVPGDPDASLLFQILEGPVGTARQMPPGVQVDDADLEQVRAWIEAGALDDQE